MCRLMRSAAPIFLLLLPGLASCQSADPSRVRDDAAAADAVPGPQLNPDSKQRVKVHGRLPGHLTIRFVIDYATTSRDPRSAEHTSELQSLMRISYSVFCLKKKNKHYSVTPKTAQKQ